MIEVSSPPVICVLGMHRSGTSCLTGSLQKAGVALGKHHTWNPYNKRGNRENQDFVDFHEGLLQSNKASWDHPPSQLHYTSQDVLRARELVASFAPGQRWGFKDPRALLAIELWQEIIPNLQYVGIFRHPAAVAKSLFRRSGGEMSLQAGYDLWLHYNRIVYSLYRKHHFPLLCFDLAEEDFHQQLEKVVNDLGLSSLAANDRFYAPELHSAEAQGWEGVPWRAKRLYGKLVKASAST